MSAFEKTLKTHKMNEHAAKWRSDVVKAVRKIAPDAVVLGLLLDDDYNTSLAVRVSFTEATLTSLTASGSSVTVGEETIPLIVLWSDSEWTVID